MVIEPGFARLLPVHLPAIAGQRHENGAAKLRMFSHTSRNLVAVDFGQADVEKNRVRMKIGGDLHSTRSIVGNLDLVVRLPEQHGQALGRVEVVVDYQDAKLPGGLRGKLSCS